MKNNWTDELCQSIQDTFGYYDDQNTPFSVMKSNIMEDLQEFEFTPWYHIHMLMDSLLPYSYQSINKTICHLIQHMKRTKRIGLNGLLHDEQTVYNVDVILILRKS